MQNNGNTWHFGKRAVDDQTGNSEDQWSAGREIFGENSEKDNEGANASQQYKAAKQQSLLNSYFNFMRQVRNQSRGFVAPAKEEAQQSPRQNFVSQFWNQSRGFVAPAKEEAQQSLRQNFVSQLWNQSREFVAAVRFLSILPLPGNAHNEAAEPKLTIGGAYFPLVGLVIALIACLVVAIGPAVRLPSLVVAALVVIALICLTGGLHLDGLMDTCDGLFGGRTRERKVEIMHDSRLGAFGVLGGISILLLKFAIFASLDLHHLILALLIVLPLARWAMVLAMSIFPNALLTGLGVAARRTITRSTILIAGITSLLIALIAGQLIGLTIWVVGSLMSLIIGIWVTYNLGGLTGDSYGAIAEITEVVGLLVLVAAR